MIGMAGVVAETVWECRFNPEWIEDPDTIVEMYPPSDSDRNGLGGGRDEFGEWTIDSTVRRAMERDIVLPQLFMRRTAACDGPAAMARWNCSSRINWRDAEQRCICKCLEHIDAAGR